MTQRLFNQLDFAWTPRLIEPSLGWTIQSQDGKPALAGNGLGPVGLIKTERLGWLRIPVRSSIAADISNQRNPYARSERVLRRNS